MPVGSESWLEAVKGKLDREQQKYSSPLNTEHAGRCSTRAHNELTGSLEVTFGN